MDAGALPLEDRQYTEYNDDQLAGMSSAPMYLSNGRPVAPLILDVTDLELTNSFAIDAPIDDVWRALNDPELVAPCFPGASLTEYSDDSFAGGVKVKLGPVSLKYQGKGTYIARDEARRAITIEAEGRDTSGNGSARAVVNGSMTADGPRRTNVTMVTELDITGRPAQFGRGLMSEVADRIIGQFATRLAATLNGATTTAEADDDSLDVLKTFAGPLLRVAAPALAVLAVVSVVFGCRRRRR